MLPVLITQNICTERNTSCHNMPLLSIIILKSSKFSIVDNIVGYVSAFYEVGTWVKELCS